MKEDVNKSKKPKAKGPKIGKAPMRIRENSSEQEKLDNLLKLTKRQPPTTAIVIAEQEPLEPELRAAIEHAMKHYLPEVVKSQKMLEEDMKNLEAHVGEFLKNFIIIGYDLAGEKIQMLHANNAQEYDSLIECARGSLLTLMIKAQQQLPGFPPGS
jgi:hypothetical protein